MFNCTLCRTLYEVITSPRFKNFLSPVATVCVSLRSFQGPRWPPCANVLRAVSSADAAKPGARAVARQRWNLHEMKVRLRIATCRSMHRCWGSTRCEIDIVRDFLHIENLKIVSLAHSFQSFAMLNVCFWFCVE